MREQRQKEIDGSVYTVTQLGAKVGKNLMFRLGKALAAAGADSTASGIASALREEDFEFVCDTFARMTTFHTLEAPSKEPRLSDLFDDHFAGRYGALVKWLAFCIEVNFGSFLDELGIDAIKSPLTAKLSTSQKVSTGT